jgi:methyl coenzyme M reductase subunit C
MMARQSAAADAETLVETPSPEHQQITKADPKLGQALKKENVQVSFEFLRFGSLEDEKC